LRLFTAIDIPAAIKAVLEDLIGKLRPLAKLQWIPLEKMHITTKFIGEWPEEKLGELKNALAGVKSAAPVDVAIRRIGWLPNPRFARVLYAGVEAGEALSALAEATEKAAASVGIPAENRIFRPHVTLARVRDRVPLGELKRALAEIELSDIGSYQASSFALYLSAGGKYTKLQEFPLTK
jgi:RNA 2',3'-cyclic 3'-phosphodiesterase